MLKKKHITLIKVGSEEWFQGRKAKLTSSSNWKLVGGGDDGFTEQGIKYIMEKVGESLKGSPDSKEFETEATRHGLYYEAEAINKFGIFMKLTFVVVQKLIVVGERFGGTPDALIVLSESPDETEYEVEPVEAKCFPTSPNYIEVALCSTPLHLKMKRPDIYWQLIDQMILCEARAGHFVCYHPEFSVGNLNIIKFDALDFTINKDGRKEYPINNDIKFLKKKRDLAVTKFYEIRDKLIEKGKY